MLCSVVQGPGPSVSEPGACLSPAKVRALLANAFPQISWLCSDVRSNFLLGPSELLTQPLNLNITMIKVITSSLQYFSHHTDACPSLSVFLFPCLPFRGPRPSALHPTGPSTTVG